MRKKRPDGEACLDHLPSGKCRVKFTTNTGKRDNTKAYPNEEEAEGVRRAIVQRLASENLASVGGVTFRQYGGHCLDRRERFGVRGIDTERYRWKWWLATAPFADRPLATIERREIRTWMDALRTAKVRVPGKDETGKRNLSPQSIKHVLALAKIIFAMAIDEEILDENPADGIKLPRQLRTHEPWTFLNAKEQQKMITCEAIPLPDRLRIQFAIGTGLRQGEQWNLELADVIIDGDDPHVVVRFGSNGKPPKNGKIRRVPLFGMAHEAVCKWLELLPRFAPKNPFALLWPGKSGGRIPRSKTYYSDSTMPAQNGRGHKGFDFRDALKAAGITRRVRWHDLRHTCASSLVAGWWGGRPWRLEEVREMLGHTSIKVTERYAHFAPGALRSVANATRPVVHPLSTAIPADLSKYSELLSGADGTRTRGLRRDRPAL
jgi:integrase